AASGIPRDCRARPAGRHRAQSMDLRHELPLQPSRDVADPMGPGRPQPRTAVSRNIARPLRRRARPPEDPLDPDAARPRRPDVQRIQLPRELRPLRVDAGRSPRAARRMGFAGPGAGRAREVVNLVWTQFLTSELPRSSPAAPSPRPACRATPP